MESHQKNGTGKLSWKLRDNTSAVIRNNEIEVKLDPLSTKEIISLNFSDILDTRQKQTKTYLEFSLIIDDNIISYGTVLFVRSKHFELLDPKISTEVSRKTINLLLK